MAPEPAGGIKIHIGFLTISALQFHDSEDALGNSLKQGVSEEESGRKIPRSSDPSVQKWREVAAWGKRRYTFPDIIR